MVTTTIQALQHTSSLILRLTSQAASSAATSQFGAAFATGARQAYSSAPASDLKAALAAQIPSQQVRVSY